jgi:hypothetical protein
MGPSSHDRGTNCLVRIEQCATDGAPLLQVAFEVVRGDLPPDESGFTTIEEAHEGRILMRSCIYVKHLRVNASWSHGRQTQSMLSVVRMNLDGTNQTTATGASSKCIGQLRSLID